MTSDICDDTVPLLRPASVAVCSSPAQDLGLEFVDSVEYRHPALFDCLDAQPEILAEFGIGLSGESGDQQILLGRTQVELRRLITIQRCRNRVRRGENAF